MTHHVLQTQLAVLNLGDIFKLGRQPADAAQRNAIGQVLLLPIKALIK